MGCVHLVSGGRIPACSRDNFCKISSVDVPKGCKPDHILVIYGSSVWMLWDNGGNTCKRRLTDDGHAAFVNTLSLFQIKEETYAIVGNGSVLKTSVDLDAHRLLFRRSALPSGFTEKIKRRRNIRLRAVTKLTRRFVDGKSLYKKITVFPSIWWRVECPCSHQACSCASRMPLV